MVLSKGITTFPHFISPMPLDVFVTKRSCASDTPMTFAMRELSVFACFKSATKEKAVKESAVKTARKTAQTAAKETAKETGKKAAKETSKAAAKTAAATAGTGAGGVLVGIAAGEAAGIAMDKRDVKNSTRNRMIKLFVAKLRQEENQDNIGKALKDIVLMRFSMMAKYIVRYVGLFLLALFAVVALIALPVIAIIPVQSGIP